MLRWIQKGENLHSTQYTFDESMEFFLNVFHWIQRTQWQNMYDIKRTWTCYLLSKRPGCYLSASKTHVRDRILELNPINAFVIYQIPWICCIQRKFCSIYEKLHWIVEQQSWFGDLKVTILRFILLESVNGRFCWKYEINVLSSEQTERQRQRHFEVLTLGLTLGNGSGTHFQASKCLMLGVFIPLNVYPYTLKSSLLKTRSGINHNWLFTKIWDSIS